MSLRDDLNSVDEAADYLEQVKDKHGLVPPVSLMSAVWCRLAWCCGLVVLLSCGCVVSLLKPDLHLLLSDPHPL